MKSLLFSIFTLLCITSSAQATQSKKGKPSQTKLNKIYSIDCEDFSDNADNYVGKIIKVIYVYINYENDNQGLRFGIWDKEPEDGFYKRKVRCEVGGKFITLKIPRNLKVPNATYNAITITGKVINENTIEVISVTRS